MHTFMIFILDVVTVMTIFVVITALILVFHYGFAGKKKGQQTDIDRLRRDVRDKDDVITCDSVFHNFRARKF